MTATVQTTPDRGIYRKGDVYDLTIRVIVADNPAADLVALRLGGTERVIYVNPSSVSLVRVRQVGQRVMPEPTDGAVEHLADVIGIARISPHVRVTNLQIARTVLDSDWLTDQKRAAIKAALTEVEADLDDYDRDNWPICDCDRDHPHRRGQERWDVTSIEPWVPPPFTPDTPPELIEWVRSCGLDPDKIVLGSLSLGLRWTEYTGRITPSGEKERVDRRLGMSA